jgi:hypothetical protein
MANYAFRIVLQVDVSNFEEVKSFLDDTYERLLFLFRPAVYWELVRFMPTIPASCHLV